jgi:hypothetical protein
MLFSNPQHSLVDPDGNYVDLTDGPVDVVAALGSPTDAGVVGDNPGSLNAKSRGANACFGANSDAAVLGDVAGSFSAKLRGIGSNLATLISNLSGFSIGTSTDGAVVGDNSGTLHSKVRGINKQIAAGYNVGGYSKLATASYTRPNDTNTYTANDAVANSTSAPVALDFTNAVRSAGGTGVLVGATFIDQSSQSVAWDLELWVFRDTVTAINDQDPFAPSDADCLKWLHTFHFTESYAGSGNKVWQAGPCSVPFSAVGTSLYGLLVVRNAYVAVANEVLTFGLGILQDA